MKRLMNPSEEQTNAVLKPLTEKWGAHTFPKVRLADVLPIENSGIDEEFFRFALQSHFDFVVTDSNLNPLFVVEFDGDSHTSPKQQRRDIFKDRLCERFQLPILRINSRYIGEKFRQMDLLSWFVNYWFAQKEIDEAYVSGQIPPDEYLDPMLMLTLPGSNKLFPLWLTADTGSEFRKLYDQGHCIDPGASTFVGRDSDGVYRTIAYMAISDGVGLFTETAMRVQRFNVPCSELLDAIAEHQLLDEFMNVNKGKRIPDSFDSICQRLAWYKTNCQWLMSAKCTQVEGLSNAL